MHGIASQTVGYYVNKYCINHLAPKHKKHYPDEHLFNKIDTKEKAYIIGYSVADACISDDYIEFRCALKDKELMDFIAAYIGDCTVNVDATYNKAAKRFPSCGFKIGNKNIVTDFNKHCSQKIDKHMPIVRRDLEPYLLLGYFDGNGCITWGHRKDRHRIWHKVCFVGQLASLIGVQKILEHNGICSSIIPKGKEKAFVLEFANKPDILKFYHLIYDPKFVVLNRKYEHFNALRLELGEFGEDQRTPSEAVEEIATERVETNG